MGRAPCCDKANVKKGPWSPEEDAKLKEYIEKYGTGGNWIALPQKAGLKRCGKSCRLRWLNYLRPNIKHGEFSDEEDRVICSLYANIGSRWSIIAAQLPGRTDNDIKNYWNTKLKKKLMGITTNKKSSSAPSPYTYHHNHNNHYAMIHHHPSSSISSPSSPYNQCTSTTYYNSPSMTMSFTGFDPNPTTPSSNNNSHGGLITMQNNYHHQVKDNNTLLMFGDHQAAAASCSSSDGSCYSSINNNSHHQVIKCEDQGVNINNYDASTVYNNGVHQDQDYQEGKPISGNSCNSTTGLWGQSQSQTSSVLDYGLEEIKQLISTNINVGINSYNYFDENKAEDSSKVMYYSY